MKNLLNIDLICIDCIDPHQAALTINYCQRHFNFGKSILITHENIDVHNIELHLIKKINLNEYSNHVLKLIEHSHNDYIMIVQCDGHIINSQLWDDEYLQYDYIGAPWPNEESWIRLQHKDQLNYIKKNFKKNRVGNGGFSIRSKKFLQFSSQYDSCGGIGEDSFLCTRKYEDAIEYGIKFAPFELAFKFSYENPCIEFDTSWTTKINLDKNKHFGWHGKNFLNTQELLSLKYQ